MVGPGGLGIAINDLLAFDQDLIEYQHPAQSARNPWSHFTAAPGDSNVLTGKVAGQPFQIVHNVTSNTLTCTMQSDARSLGGTVGIVMLATFAGTAAGAALAAALGLPLFAALGPAAVAAATGAIVTYVIGRGKNTNGPVPTWVANDGGTGNRETLLQAAG